MAKKKPRPQQFVVLPTRGLRATPQTSSAALAPFLTALTNVRTAATARSFVSAAGLKIKGHFKVLDSIREDGAKLVEMTPDTAKDLQASQPGLRIVLSCAGNARERAKLDDLLPRLREPPWKVYAGTLDVTGLAALIETCALNLSGDTGSLHLAMMTQAPAAAWFRAHKGQNEWIPLAPQYRVLIVEGGAPDSLHGIATDALLAAAAELLHGYPPRNSPSRCGAHAAGASSVKL